MASQRVGAAKARRASKREEEGERERARAREKDLQLTQLPHAVFDRCCCDHHGLVTRLIVHPFTKKARGEADVERI